MALAHLGHRGHKLIEGFGDAGAGPVGRAFAAGPNVGRMFDFSDMLTKLRDGPLPKDSVAAFIQKMRSILAEGPVELLGAHSPHLLHCVLPFLAELEASGALIQ